MAIPGFNAPQSVKTIHVGLGQLHIDIKTAIKEADEDLIAELLSAWHGLYVAYLGCIIAYEFGPYEIVVDYNTIEKIINPFPCHTCGVDDLKVEHYHMDDELEAIVVNTVCAKCNTENLVVFYSPKLIERLIGE